MFRPGELDEVELSFDHPAGWWPAFGDLDDGCWLSLRAGSESFIHPVAKVGFWLEDIEWVAHELADKLAEWIAESSFGWGEWRSLPDGWTAPPPLPDRTTVSVHFGDDEGALPLWSGGLPAPWLETRLSPELVADMRAWQALGEQLAQAAERARAELGPPPMGGAVTFAIEFVSEERAAREAGAERAAAAEARDARRAWIEALEPWRDELTARLRAELGPDFDIPTPPRVR